MSKIDYTNLNNNIDNRFKNCLVGVGYSETYNVTQKTFAYSDIKLAFNAKNIPTAQLMQVNDFEQNILLPVANQIVNNIDVESKKISNMSIIFKKEANIGIAERHYTINTSYSIKTWLEKIKENNIDK